MNSSAKNMQVPGSASCTASLSALEDSLYVIGGKWKLKIIIALREQGNKRFNELQRIVTGISAKVLSNELKELELNGFVKRNVYPQTPVIIEYELTGYSETLNSVLMALIEWGFNHRKKILKESKKKRNEAMPA
jgi:DNA-binding HxlR family transcriptional regulator